MYLKRLELYGFKSFAGRTVLLFDPGLTAVVGPNGSGKSNLADALRWVLGEQSARSLRGSSMQDVIFGGSQQERALGYAEVAITFDNEDRRLHFPGSEVTVCRRLYRSGESEYRLGGVNCRLRDIEELLLDQGLAGGAFLVGQGEIDALVSAHPQERRLILEDLAGIGHFRRQREEATRQLAQADANLHRLADLISGLTAELATAQPQVEAGRARLRLELEHAQLEEHLLAGRQRGLEVASAGLGRRLQTERDERQRRLAAKERLQQTLAEAAAAVDRLGEQQNQEQTDLARWREQRERLLREQAQLDQEAGWLARQCRELEQRAARAASEWAAGQQRLQTLTQERQQAVAAWEQVKAVQQQRQQQWERQNQEWSRLQQQADERVKAADQARQQQEKAQRLADRLRERREALLGRLRQADAELATLAQQQEQTRQALAQAQASQREAEELLVRQKAEQATLGAQKEQAASAQTRVEEQLQALQVQLHTLAARRQALVDWTQDGEGLPRAVRALLKPSAKADWELIGVMADLLEVPAHLAAAVEVALGGAQFDLVVPHAEDARRAIEFLRSERLGRATFLPLDSLRISPLPATDRDELGRLPSEQFVGRLSERVACSPLAQKACEYLLGRWALFSELRFALPVSRRLTPAVRCITLAGDVVIPGGAVSGGSAEAQRRPGRVRQRQQLAELSAQIDSLRRQLASVTAERAAGALRLHDVSTQLNELERSLAVVGERLRQGRERIRQQQAELSRLEAAYQQASGHRQATADELAAVDQQLSSLPGATPATNPAPSGAAPSASESGSGPPQPPGQPGPPAPVDAWQQALAVLTATREQVQREQQQAQQELRAAERELLQAEARVQQCEQRYHEAEQRCADWQQQEQAAAEQLQALRQRQKERQSRRSQVNAQLQELDQEQTRREEHLAWLARARKEAIRQRHLHQQQLQQLEQAEATSQQRAGRRQAALARLQAEIRWNQERQREVHEHLLSLHKLALTIPAAAARAEAAVAVDVNGHRTRRELSSRWAELGRQLADQPPLPTGLFAEFYRQRQRVEELRQEQADVVSARQELQAWMDQLDREAARRLQDSFGQAQNAFSQTFVSLFGGGQAELSWVGDDPLEAGVEIHVQPPGKRLQNLSLLSGGEKALTALAFLLGVAALKPPPVCVLDEADSALDEANLARFLSLLETSARQTQFLLITHRRTTMERAGSLYGVTMDTSGISRVYAYHLDNGKPQGVVNTHALVDR